MAQEAEAAAAAAAGRVQQHFATRDFSRPGYWTGSGDADTQNGHNGAALVDGKSDDRGSDEGLTSPDGARRLHTTTNGDQASRDQGQAGPRSPGLKASPAAIGKAPQAAASLGVVSPLSSGRSRRRAVRSENASRNPTVSPAAPAAAGGCCGPAGRSGGDCCGEPAWGFPAPRRLRGYGRCGGRAACARAGAAPRTRAGGAEGPPVCGEG